MATARHSAEPMPPAVRRTDQELAVHRTVGRLSGSECGLHLGLRDDHLRRFADEWGCVGGANQ